MLDFLPLALRYLHVAALLLCCGAGLYLGWISVNRTASPMEAAAQTLYRYGTGVIFATTLLMLPAQAASMSGDWQALGAPHSWWQVLQYTRYGQAWLWQLMLLPALGLALWCNRRIPAHRALAAATGAMLVALAATGHAAAMSGWAGWLHRSNQALHFLAIAAWAGGLPWVVATLGALHGPQRAAATQTLIRYSRCGHLAVLLAVVTGAVNLWFILGPWPWGWSSLYMRLMTLKILAVALMIALALDNRYRLVPRLRRDPQALRTLTRHTGWGIGLSVVILLLIGLTSTLPPD